MKLTEAARKFINEDLGGPKEASEFFNKKESAVKVWVKTGNFPKEVYDAMMFPEPEVELPPEPEGIGASSPELDEPIQGESETFTSNSNPEYNSDVGEVDLNEQRFADLHQRVQALEGAVFTKPEFQAPTRGVPRQASMARPGGGYQGIPVKQPGGAYNAGISTGRAPTREQAYWSSRGQRGAPAGPAAPRQRKPGAPGTYNWNSHEKKSNSNRK